MNPGRRPRSSETPDDLQAALAEVGYFADDALGVAAWLTISLRRPLFLEGDPGVGKTSLAAALSKVVGGPLIRLQCYEGIDQAQALYDWDFAKQVLSLRTNEGAEVDLYDRRFLLERPLLRALQTDPCVLLIDEVDRADDEFEALLLEVLGDFSVTVPELGTIRAELPPIVVLTSNRTREVHDALKRRCYYAWVEHPDAEREAVIVRRHVPEATSELIGQVVALIAQFRGLELLKAPGVAEAIDWTASLVALGIERLDAESAARTLGCAVKVREDQELLHHLPLSDLLAHRGTDATS